MNFFFYRICSSIITNIFITFWYVKSFFYLWSIYMLNFYIKIIFTLTNIFYIFVFDKKVFYMMENYNQLADLVNQFYLKRGGCVRKKVKKCTCGCDIIIKRKGGRLVEECACDCKHKK